MAVPKSAECTRYPLKGKIILADLSDQKKLSRLSRDVRQLGGKALTITSADFLGYAQVHLVVSDNSRVSDIKSNMGGVRHALQVYKAAKNDSLNRMGNGRAARMIQMQRAREQRQQDVNGNTLRRSGRISASGTVSPVKNAHCAKVPLKIHKEPLQTAQKRPSHDEIAREHPKHPKVQPKKLCEPFMNLVHKNGRFRPFYRENIQIDKTMTIYLSTGKFHQRSLFHKPVGGREVSPKKQSPLKPLYVIPYIFRQHLSSSSHKRRTAAPSFWSDVDRYLVTRHPDFVGTGVRLDISDEFSRRLNRNGSQGNELTSLRSAASSSMALPQSCTRTDDQSTTAGDTLTKRGHQRVVHHADWPTGDSAAELSDDTDPDDSDTASESRSEQNFDKGRLRKRSRPQ